MVWAIDQVDQKSTSLLYPKEWTKEEIAEAESAARDEVVNGVCYTTKCGDKCRKGDHEASQMNGQPGQLSTMERCPKGDYRRLCCTKGTIMGKCRWRGYRGLGLPCTGGCADLETEVTQNTNHHSDKEDQSCTGGTQSYCCAGFSPPVTKEQVQRKFKDEAADKAVAVAEALALELAAKAFCRIAITAALTPLTFIPFVGWIIRLAVQAAVPALANVCAKGIAKGGKSVFKFRGKDYDVKLDKPLTTKNDRGSKAEPTRPSEKDGHCKLADEALEKRARLRPLSKTETRFKEHHTTVTKVCDGEKWPQPCLHYSSVIDKHPENALMTCTTKNNGDIREVVHQYVWDHDKGWINGWMRAKNVGCERDEFPPAAIWQARNQRVWIRLLPQAQNRGAGSLFRNVCPARFKVGPADRKPRRGRVERGCKRRTSHFVETRTRTRTVVSMSFINMPALRDYGIPDNPCWPEMLVPDPGFALMTNDPWYNAHPTNKKYTQLYQHRPGPEFTSGKKSRPGYNLAVDPEDIVVDEGNSTRQATEEELFENYGFLQCKDSECKDEMEELGVDYLPRINLHDIEPPVTSAYTTLDTVPTSLSGDAVTETLEELHMLITQAPEL
ncbi:hypothetical protein B0I35DRAFT_504515 [Stachybotrys elegans]|uniref:Uncharacterized protein n=1 Tax=Stachybotrys elegans TaxID=80388 RepID=A0A8K0SP58_9HYPO|nr:hypothetical protein B0I35DRAFT_504515 [Stachybotrys elegans]